MYIGALPPASNRARYELALQVIDEETSEPIDLTGYDIVLSVGDRGSQILTATNDDGIDIADAENGIFVVTFTRTQMRRLCAMEYEVGCTIAPEDDDEETDQYIIGSLPVLDGVVR